MKNIFTVFSAIAGIGSSFLAFVEGFSIEYIILMWGALSVLIILTVYSVLFYRNKWDTFWKSKTFHFLVGVLATLFCAFFFWIYDNWEDKKEHSYLRLENTIRLDSRIIEDANDNDNPSLKSLLIVAGFYETNFNGIRKAKYDSAMYYYRKAILYHRDTTALYKLGMMYYNGFGSKVDYRSAYYNISSAADFGMLKAQRQLVYLNSHAAFKSIGEINVKKWIENLVSQVNDGNSFNYYGILSINEDFQYALKLLQHSSELKCIDGMFNYAFFLVKAQKYQEAESEFLKLVDLKYSKAYFWLGMLYGCKYIRNKSFKDAIVYFEAGAELNNSDCIDKLVGLYLYGTVDTERDFDKANYWLNVSKYTNSDLDYQKMNSEIERFRKGNITKEEKEDKLVRYGLE